ncbi:hypothetical protein ACHWGW_16090, partial [Klebsiella pneumoniae]
VFDAPGQRVVDILLIIQRSKSASFPQGTSWHDVQLDNQQYIDHALPGRIEHRGREVVKVMLPLVKELAKVEKKS